MTASAAAQLGVGVGGISLSPGRSANISDAKSPTILDAHALARRLSEFDFGFKRGYMRALMQFADDDDNNNKSQNAMQTASHQDIDSPSHSVALTGGDDGWKRHGPFQEPKVTSTTTTVGGPVESSGNSGVGMAESTFSFRITQVPYTWQPGESFDLPDNQDATTPAPAARQSQPPPPPPPTIHLDSKVLDEVFQEFSLIGSDDLSLQVPGSQPSQDSKTMSTVTVSTTVETRREERHNATVTMSSFGSMDDFGSASSMGRGYRYPSISTGRPSTSTTQSSSSASGTSSGEGRRHMTNSSPRRPGSIFSRLRPRLGSVSTGDDFIERRSLTPHELLAPIPRQDMPLPPLPMGEMLDGELVDGLCPAHLEPTRREPAKPVFGVDLNDSIRLAPMRIKISHRGNSTSSRTFPLSVYKCCEFIRKSEQPQPNLFASPGDAYNVSQLRDIFNSPPYGEHFDFNMPNNRHFTVFDAARLILLFLQDLPKPLVSASVVKGWIMLARQDGAIEPPASRPLETGLDFWSTALDRLPAANRNLTKHLLTLFAETVTKRDEKGHPIIGEADARNLASSVARAMFHLEDGGGAKGNQKNVHATLALAFLVKKRGEYLSSLGGRGKTAFLPSTKEMLAWKGSTNNS